MDIVDDQLTRMSDAEPGPKDNDFYTASYSNIYFLKRKGRMCQFIFDEKGLNATKLTFKTSAAYSRSDLDYFRDELTMVYGIPVQMTRPAYQKEYSGYIDGCYWFNGRLALTLMPGNKIIINAFRDNCQPPDAPAVLPI